MQSPKISKQSKIQQPYQSDWQQPENNKVATTIQSKKQNIFSEFLTYLKLGFGGVDVDTHD